MGNEFIRAQAYKHRVTGEVVLMERLNSNRVVLHLSTGPEKVTEGDLKEEYTCLGKWSDYEAGILDSKPAAVL